MSVRNAIRSRMEATFEAVDKEYREQLLDAVPRERGKRLLDVGCDDGAWTEAIAGQIGAGPSDVAGIEIVEDRRNQALARGFDVRPGDLDQRWPFDDGRFDIVHANQVIEHVHRLDHFVLEVARVLRPKGVAVICTENLSSWHNVGAAALGYMPFSLTNVSMLGAVGNPLAIHSGIPTHQPESWQHTHVLTLRGLCSIFELHGFSIERVFGTGYYPAVGRVASRFASCDPWHAHFIGVVAVRGNLPPSQVNPLPV